MVSRLDCGIEDYVWEPCAGQGDLVAGILDRLPKARIRISERDEHAASHLRRRFQRYSRVTVTCEDALDFGSFPLFGQQHGFTRIIANPPYGAWQTPERRLQLKTRYPGLYVRETYSVFIFHCLQLLRPGGRFVFIVPDTFLWLNRHEFLRRTLLQEATIREITLFPSKFFTGVKFGYSGLAIVCLDKEVPSKGSRIRVNDQLADSSELKKLARESIGKSSPDVTWLSQNEVLAEPHAVLKSPAREGDIDLASRVDRLLENVADVRTGFYSGNNRMWLRRADSNVPRSRGHRDVDVEQIAQIAEGDHPPLYGIDSHRHYIPIVRGGALPYVKPTRWYVNWSKSAVEEYRRRGKNPARFQNSGYYFRQGIAVPMVASSQLTGAYLNNRLFDQSIVGVFPHDERLSRYFLGFLNTHLATTLVRRINGTANNSANYLKRLPITLPSEDELDVANEIVSAAVSEVRECDALSSTTYETVEEYYRRLWCAG